MAASLTAAFARSCSLIDTTRSLARNLRAKANTHTLPVRSVGCLHLHTPSQSQPLTARGYGTTTVTSNPIPRFALLSTIHPKPQRQRPFDPPKSRTITTLLPFQSPFPSPPSLHHHHHHHPNQPPPPFQPIGPIRTLATQKHKRIIKKAKGYRGRSKNTFRAAIRRVEKGMQYAYRDRKLKKRNFRRLWIERINAGARQHGVSYSKLMDGMMRMGGREEVEGGKEEGMVLNRKVLADLAMNEPFSFKAVVDVVGLRNRELGGVGGDKWKEGVV